MVVGARRTASRGASGGSSWAELLLRDPSDDQVEQRQRTLVAAATTAAERAGIEAEASAARRLWSQQQDHRRRLAELAALNDLGVRLAAMHDLDALLQEVVTQARRLLDVDVAYLALAEPDRALTILVTDGSLSPHLRGVRLAPRSGLAGRVLETGEPVSTHDYLADDVLTHDERLDRVAEVEGLKTITGVPLRVRGDVIGVLMTAQRAVRPPTANELSLLSSLASLAAVAIENARLFAQHGEAMAAIAAANDELRRAADSVNRAVILHERLMQVAVRGGGVSQVIASLSELIDGDVMFIDSLDRTLVAARAGQPIQSPGAPRDVNGLAAGTAFAESAARRTVVDGTTATVPVTGGEHYYGALQVDASTTPDDGTVRLLERSAMTLALIEAVERQVAEAERRTTDELLEQLVGRRLVADDATHRRALGLGLDLSRPHLVLVATPGEGGLEAFRVWARRLVTTYGGVIGSVAATLTVIVGAEAETDLSDAPGPGEAVGRSGPATGVNELAAAFVDAQTCLRALQALGHRNRVAAAADLGPFRFLLSSSGRADAQRFVDHNIGRLLEHDARRGTSLVDTARCYLANGQRHADTARELGIHPNTLYQRLSRLDAILGPGWLHESRCLDIQLALRINDISA